MPSRRSHQNSHHGCAQCKARRVKCDESRPICVRCHRQGRQCTYSSMGPGTTWAPPVPPLQPPPPPSPQDHHHHHYHLQPVHTGSPDDRRIPLPSPFLPPPAASLSSSSPTVRSPRELSEVHSPPTPSSSASTGIRISSLLSPPSPAASTPHRPVDPHRHDLKLMHHWASRTSSVVPCQPRTEAVWRDFVAEQALEHDFLLHALFSVCAFHLAAIEHEDAQLNKDVAMEHHSLSISLAQPALRNITTDNCHALFAFSCFTAIVSFATPALTSPNTRDPLKEVIDGFLLWRGISAVVESCFEAVARGPMGTLFYIPDHKHPEYITDDMKASLKLLEERNASLDIGEAAKLSYSGAISQLYVLFASCTGNHEEFNAETAVFGWPILVPKDYIDTLSKSEPMALAILAHYAVMLHNISHVWWAANWGPGLVDAVDKLLDDSWEACLQWPRDKVHNS